VASQRIDGAYVPDSLIEYINIEDNVDERLSLRTQEDYSRKMLIFSNQIKKNGHGDMTPENLVTHFCNIVSRKQITQSTARAMKAAALFWITEESKNVLTQGKSLYEYEIAYKAIKELSIRDLSKRSNKTSGNKLKFFPKTVLENLISYAKNTSRSKHAGVLISFLRANLLVGLRPSEWFGTKLISYIHRDEEGNYILTNKNKIKSTCALHVENAKNTHGRGNGSYREILLYGVSDNDLAAIMHFHKIIQSFSSRFTNTTPRNVIAEAFFKPLQQTMSHALKKMGYTKHQLPTTYSTRHQAVANAKYSGLSDREIAAMFGHVSPATAKIHYGRKINGWMKVSFRPSPESISAVSIKETSYELSIPNQKTLDRAAEWNHNCNEIY